MIFNQNQLFKTINRSKYSCIIIQEGDAINKVLKFNKPAKQLFPELKINESVWTCFNESFQCIEQLRENIHGFYKEFFILEDLVLKSNGKVFDFNVTPVSFDGISVYYLIQIIETMESYKNTQIIQPKNLTDSLKRVEDSNEFLTSSNDALDLAMKGLSASNAQLVDSQLKMKAVNLELAKSEMRFKTLIKQASVGISVIDANTLIVTEVNDLILQIIGKDRALVENHLVWDGLPELAESYAPILIQVIKSGIPYYAIEHEVTLIKQGIPTVLFIDFVLEPIKDHDKILSILVVAFDVTDKVMSRRKIEDIEERIRLAIDASEIGTFEYIYPNNSMVASDRFYQIFGFTRAVGREDILNVMHPEDKHLSDEAHLRARTEGKLQYEARILHPDGVYHWVRVQANLYLDSNREPARLLGTALDITEFKRLQQQKEDFLSIASHELKTPITSLKASLQLLERFKNDPNSPMLPKLITQSAKSINKITSLVDDLLNVGRLSIGSIPLNKTRFNLLELIKECCANISVSENRKIEIRGENMEIYADEHKIDQVITNMVSNSIKHAVNTECIQILCKKTQDNRVKVEIIDGGPGIPSQKIPFLFDRYYQVNPGNTSSAGLGLGLYISAEIIQRHNGEIGVNSELGRGSTFWFILPV